MKYHNRANNVLKSTSIKSLVLSLCFALVNYSCGNEQSSAQVVKPNILMISVDDMNDWVGCLNGYPGVETPNIDRLASQGINFTNAHCASPKCGPSRTAIMTGLRPSTSGIYDNNQWWAPNLPEVTTMPEFFMENGYKVLGGGKIYHHTAGNNPPDQWNEFFRIVFDDNWDRAKPGQDTAPWVDFEPMPENIPLNGINPFRHEYDWGSLDKPIDKYGDMHAVRWAKKQLQKQHDSPFFLAVGFFHPHLPWYAPKEFFEQYPLEDIVLPENPEDDLDDIPTVGLKLAENGSIGFKKVLEHNKYKEAVQAYLANISFADHMVGEVVEALQKSQYANNTLVVFWSDHGWHLGEKNHWYKSTLWQRSTHVPFIVAGPGVPEHVKNDSPVSLLDIFPTLAEYCGIQHELPLEGNSLLPFFENPTFIKEKPTLITYQKDNHALHGPAWKYIKYRDGGEELYNLRNDPHEWTNLASQNTYNNIKSEMQVYLPSHNEDAKPTKKAFDFDFDTYTWKKTGIQ